MRVSCVFVRAARAQAGEPSAPALMLRFRLVARVSLRAVQTARASAAHESCMQRAARRGAADLREDVRAHVLAKAPLRARARPGRG